MLGGTGELDQIILEINKVKDKLHCIQSDYLEILTMSHEAIDDRQRSLDKINKDATINKDGSVKFSIPLLKHSISIAESHTSKSISRLSLLRQLIVDQSNLSRLTLSAKLNDSSMFKFNVIDMIRNKVTIHSDNRNACTAAREIRTPSVMIEVDNHDSDEDYQVENTYNVIEIETSSSIRYRGRFDLISNINHDHHHRDDNDDGDNDDGHVPYTFNFDINNNNEQNDDCDSNLYPDKAFLVNYCNAVAFLLSCYYILITLVPSLYPSTNHSTDTW